MLLNDDLDGNENFILQYQCYAPKNKDDFAASSSETGNPEMQF